MEAALDKTPIVISYKGSLIAYWIYLMLRYLKYVALPNIITGRPIVKEFLQNDAKPDLIASEVLSLLHDQTKRNKMIQELEQIQEQLGDKIASSEVARIIFENIN